MKRTITLNTFRRVAAAEEAMMRAMMPATSAASPEPLPKFAVPTELVASRGGSRLVRPLTATLAELTH